MNEINQGEQDELDKQRGMELEIDRIEKKQQEADRNRQRKLSGLVAGALKTAATGKLLKGKGIFMKFLIVSGAIIATFFGVGLQPLLKCLKEKPFFTVLVIVFWILLIVALFILFVVLIAYAACSTFLGEAASSVYSFFTGEADICGYFRTNTETTVPDFRPGRFRRGGF